MPKIYSKAIIALAVAFCVPFITAQAGNVIKPQPEERNIIILDPNDPLPRGATELQDVEVDSTSFKVSYSYFEVMQTLKKKALEQNANIIKITEKIVDGKNECCRVSAILYRADNVHKYEKEFAWTKERKLTWDDFRGRINIPVGEQETVAVSYCGFSFETNSVTLSNKVQILVRNSFRKDMSWVLPDERTAQVLEHEQGHFDLCEIYTRKLRDRFNSLTVNVYNLNSVLAEAYREIGDACKARQAQYEAETEHGQNTAQQKKWEHLIQKELVETEEWMM